MIVTTACPYSESREEKSKFLPKLDEIEEIMEKKGFRDYESIRNSYLLNSFNNCPNHQYNNKLSKK